MQSELKTRAPAQKTSVVTDDSELTPTHPEDPDYGTEALALIERVIAAHGGRENFAKTRRGIARMTVAGFPGMPADTDVEVTEYFDMPSRFRRDALSNVGGNSNSLSYVINERGSWMRIDDTGWRPNPLPEGQQVGNFVARNFDNLLALADSSRDLTLTQVKTPDGYVVTVMKHMVNDNWVGDLVIDSNTNLMFGSSHPVYSMEQHEYVESRTYYKNYKTFDGVVVPTSFESFQDGKAAMRITVKEITFVDTLNSAIFEIDAE